LQFDLEASSEEQIR